MIVTSGDDWLVSCLPTWSAKFIQVAPQSSKLNPPQFPPMFYQIHPSCYSIPPLFLGCWQQPCPQARDGQEILEHSLADNGLTVLGRIHRSTNSTEHCRRHMQQIRELAFHGLDGPQNELQLLYVYIYTYDNPHPLNLGFQGGTLQYVIYIFIHFSGCFGGGYCKLKP